MIPVSKITRLQDYYNAKRDRRSKKMKTDGSLRVVFTLLRLKTGCLYISGQFISPTLISTQFLIFKDIFF